MASRRRRRRARAASSCSGRLLTGCCSRSLVRHACPGLAGAAASRSRRRRAHPVVLDLHRLAGARQTPLRGDLVRVAVPVEDRQRPLLEGEENRARMRVPARVAARLPRLGDHDNVGRSLRLELDRVGVDRHLVGVRPTGKERPDGASPGVASATPTAMAMATVRHGDEQQQERRT